MSEYGLDPNALSQATQRVLSIFEYWKNGAAGRKMPRRSDFDPMAVAGHLPGILLIDVEGTRPDGTGLYRYRVVGQWEVAARGHNPTGKLVDEGFHAESKESALRDYDQVRQTGQPYFGILEFVNERGIPIDEFSIILPYSEDGETVSQLIVYSEQREK